MLINGICYLNRVCYVSDILKLKLAHVSSLNKLKRKIKQKFSKTGFGKSADYVIVKQVDFDDTVSVDDSSGEDDVYVKL